MKWSERCVEMRRGGEERLEGMRKGRVICEGSRDKWKKEKS